MKKTQLALAVFLFFVSLANPQGMKPELPAGYKLWPNTTKHIKELRPGVKLTGLVYLRIYGDAEIRKPYLFPEMVEEIWVNGQPVYYIVLQGGQLSALKKPGKVTISVRQKNGFAVREFVLPGKISGLEVSSVVRGLSNEELTAFRKELGTKALKFANNPIISTE